MHLFTILSVVEALGTSVYSQALYAAELRIALISQFLIELETSEILYRHR